MGTPVKGKPSGLILHRHKKQKGRRLMD